ncbi:MAG: hypothetical protein N3E40_00535, partial [Dehalococcoidia bacterium]|nr:hypothetical protein [Dehalococcoidia bacterium]
VHGCSLPYDKKPFLCRIYPLDFNITRGTIYLLGDTNCPVGASALNVDEVLLYFNDSLTDLKRHFQEFRKEWLALLGMMERTSPDRYRRTTLCQQTLRRPER